MKKKKSGKGSAGTKRKGPAKTVNEYLAGAPEKSRAMLRKMRAAIRSVVPRSAAETISYGIPAFRHNGIVVWYAAFARHCSLFPTASVIEEFRNELKGLTVSKGTVQFRADIALPIGLIQRLVKARVNQMQREK